MNNLQFKEMAHKAGFTKCTETVQEWLVKYGEEIVAETIEAIWNDVPIDDPDLAHKIGLAVKRRWNLL